MQVLKFGGTSVGSVENMTNVKNIINDGQQKIIVLSAMSGTTNALLAISESIANNEAEKTIEQINRLLNHYFETIDETERQNVFDEIQPLIYQLSLGLFRIVVMGEVKKGKTLLEFSFKPKMHPPIKIYQFSPLV